MTTDLEPRIRELFRELADQTAITPDVHPATASAGRVRRDRSRWVYVTAAAATLALVAAVVVVRVQRDAAPAGPAPVPGEPVGIFPAGDAERVVAIGYDDPSEIAAGYLADRFPRPADRETTFARLHPPLFNGAADAAVVVFESPSGDGSSSTGRLLTRRVEDGVGGAGWVIVAADIGGAFLDDLSLDAGHLHGLVTTHVTGTGTLRVNDADDGATIVEGEVEVADEGDAGEPELGFIDVSDVAAGAVSVQFWNFGRLGSDGPAYAEALVRQGDDPSSTVAMLNEVVNEVRVGPFDGDTTTSAATIEGRREILREQGVTVAITDGYQGGPPDPALRGGLCIDTTLAGSGSSLCWWPGSEMTVGTATMFVATANKNLALVVGVVPDTVGSVTTPAGRAIPADRNVWYVFVDVGLHTFVLESSDRAERETLVYGLVPMGVRPG